MDMQNKYCTRIFLNLWRDAVRKKKSEHIQLKHKCKDTDGKLQKLQDPYLQAFSMFCCILFTSFY